MTNPEIELQEVPFPYGEPIERTPEEEQDIALTRMVHDGEIAQRIIEDRNGEIDARGVLHPSRQHKLELHHEARVIPALEAFAETIEGKQCDKALAGIGWLSEKIGADYFEHAVEHTMKDGEIIFPWTGFDFDSFVADNNLALVNSEVLKDGWTADKRKGALEAYSAVDTYRRNLTDLRDHLALYSDYRIGSVVNVDSARLFGNASSMPSHGKWQISRVLASGELCVKDEGTGSVVNLSLSELDRLNGTPRTRVAPELEV